MGKKIQRSKEELEALLEEQINFMKRSADAYDEGFYDEAKRLALSIRILLHDTKNSHSLLGQLGRLKCFISTALPYDPNNLATYSGLIMIHHNNNKVEYVAMLDDIPNRHIEWLPFEQWWKQPIFVDNRKHFFLEKI